jgi:polysaccharide pyruvyl transferase WcaK-like protein
MTENLGPRIGYWSRGNLGRFAEAFRPWIFEREILGRLPGARVQAYAPLGPRHGAARGGGPAVAELGQWAPGRLAELADALDCVVVGGEDSIQASDVLLCADYGRDAEEAARTRPAAFFLEGLGSELESRCPVSWDAVSVPARLDRLTARRLQEAALGRPYLSVRDAESRDRLLRAGIRAEITVVPDPLFLLPRLLPAAVLSRRLEFIRHMEWYPKEGRTLVLQGGRSLVPSAEAIADAIAQATAAPGVAVVLLPLDPGDGEFLDAAERVLPGPLFRVPPEAALEDRVAVFAHAQGFVGSSRAGAVVAAAFGTPVLRLAIAGKGSSGSSEDGFPRFAAGSDLQPAIGRILSANRTPAGPSAEVEQRLDAHFDTLARAADEAFVRRLREEGDPVPRLLALLREGERVLDAWRVAWESRSREVVEGRLRMAAALENELAGQEEELARRGAERDAAAGEVSRLSADCDSRGLALAAERAAREAVEAEVSGATAEIGRLRGEEQRAAERLEALGRALDAAHAEVAFEKEDGERRRARAESAVAALRAELERAEAKLEMFRAGEAELRVSQTLLFTEVAEARSDVARLLAEVEELASRAADRGRP